MDSRPRFRKTKRSSTRCTGKKVTRYFLSKSDSKLKRKEAGTFHRVPTLTPLERSDEPILINLFIGKFGGRLEAFPLGAASVGGTMPRIRRRRKTASLEGVPRREERPQTFLQTSRHEKLLVRLSEENPFCCGFSREDTVS